MKLIDNRNGIEVYDLENGYTVAKEPTPWTQRGYILRFYMDPNRKYLPEIYDHMSSASGRDDEKWAFRIQTVSFGSLPPDQIEKMISEYQTALEAICLVKEAFRTNTRELSHLHK